MAGRGEGADKARGDTRPISEFIVLSVKLRRAEADAFRQSCGELGLRPRRPQAMVKMIRGGGVASAGALADQMRYLSRDGEIGLEASERYFGIPIVAEDARALAELWGVPGRAQGPDRATHFVVSFPEGTDEDAAYRAGRAWADAMFGSGRYGYVWDYYTAFHTDTPNPHCHVVVSRRGIEHGEWLKVSRRSAIDYDELRRV